MKKVISLSHENYNRAEKLKPGSEKNFGITLGSAFLLIALLPLISKNHPRFWALIVTVTFYGLAFIRPSLLKMLNILWLRLGLLLNALVSPIILLLLYFVAFIPTGLLLKLFKKDILDLKINKNSDTYWIKSESSTNSMRDQF
ncbi:MAG: SxtJ family membrane protein [Bdellovibrionota bacterium]